MELFIIISLIIFSLFSFEVNIKIFSDALIKLNVIETLSILGSILGIGTGITSPVSFNKSGNSGKSEAV